MKSAAALTFLAGLIVAGCAATHTVAVTSYHTVTAPVRLVHHAMTRKSDASASAGSHVANSNQPVAAETPRPTPHLQPARSKAASTAPGRRVASHSQTVSKPSPSPSPSPRVAEKKLIFPVARAVPGKPGLVYSPFSQNGAMIDVSGYPPGSKVKDPDTQKIFVVP
jgi:hypothetical protein